MSDAECREWQGARSTTGYGNRRPDDQRRRSGRPVLVHRWVWEQVNGPIPPGMEVMHTCDNPPCFLLEHLRLGTHAENMADMVAKGRHVAGRHYGHYGEANPATTLTAAQVVEIRSALTAGESQRSIAERYGVSQSTISRINTGFVWKNR